MEKVIFFEQEKNSTVLREFNIRLDSLSTETEFEKFRNRHISRVISSMVNAPAQWDDLCQINISWIGESFIDGLSEINSLQSKEYLDDVFSSCYRFLLELYLSMKENLGSEYRAVKDFADESFELFEDRAKQQINYAKLEMPIGIFKSIANSDSIQGIKKLDELVSDLYSKKDSWDKDIFVRSRMIK